MPLDHFMGIEGALQEIAGSPLQGSQSCNVCCEQLHQANLRPSVADLFCTCVCPLLPCSRGIDCQYHGDCVFHADCFDGDCCAGQGWSLQGPVGAEEGMPHCRWTATAAAATHLTGMMMTAAVYCAAAIFLPPNDSVPAAM